MKKKKNQKKVAVTLLVVALLSLSVAFAALSKTLTINGTGLVDPDKWDVHFANLGEAKITGIASITSDATLTDDTSITGFDVVLRAPGDSVTYTFDVVNGGGVDAKITDIIKATPVFSATTTDESKIDSDTTIVSDNLVYTLIYTDTKEAVAINDTLNAKETKNLTLKVAYSEDATSLPSSNVEISGLDIDIVYGQN